MIPLFLLLSAIGLGWAIREMTLLGLSKLNQHQQTVRLKSLMGPSRKALPLQTLLFFIEGNLQLLGDSNFFMKYLVFLSAQLRRMNRMDLKPTQIIGYQLLGGMAGILVFGPLLESFWFTLFAFGLGLGLPLLWLQDKVRQRESRLLRELPNALEVLSLCSEAGLTLEQGMDQYLKNSKPGPLKDEFAAILEQTRSGSNRKNALEAVSTRLDLTDFSLFTTSLIQAERFGTGIAKTLRQLSLTMRDKQSQKAEKAVQEMPVKMLLPLVFCIMPVTFLIIFGPILLQFLHP
jgi:tight adherence protein C